MSKELQDIVNKSKLILSNYGVTSSFIFGSFARNEQRSDSDVDILLSEFPENMSLYDLADLKHDLESSLACSVDLVTERSIKHPKLRISVMSNLIPIK